MRLCLGLCALCTWARGSVANAEHLVSTSAQSKLALLRTDATDAGGLALSEGELIQIGGLVNPSRLSKVGDESFICVKQAAEVKRSRLDDEYPDRAQRLGDAIKGIEKDMDLVAQYPPNEIPAAVLMAYARTPGTIEEDYTTVLEEVLSDVERYLEEGDDEFAAAIGVATCSVYDTLTPLLQGREIKRVVLPTVEKEAQMTIPPTANIPVEKAEDLSPRGIPLSGGGSEWVNEVVPETLDGNRRQMTVRKTKAGVGLPSAFSLESEWLKNMPENGMVKYLQATKDMKSKKYLIKLVGSEVVLAKLKIVDPPSFPSFKRPTRFVLTTGDKDKKELLFIEKKRSSLTKGKVLSVTSRTQPKKFAGTYEGPTGELPDKWLLDDGSDGSSRESIASKKNFKLTNANDSKKSSEAVVFGRASKKLNLLLALAARLGSLPSPGELFHLDVGFPFSPLEAFAIAIASIKSSPKPPRGNKATGGEDITAGTYVSKLDKPGSSIGVQESSALDTEEPLEQPTSADLRNAEIERMWSDWHKHEG